ERVTATVVSDALQGELVVVVRRGYVLRDLDVGVLALEALDEFVECRSVLSAPVRERDGSFWSTCGRGCGTARGRRSSSPSARPRARACGQNTRCRGDPEELNCLSTRKTVTAVAVHLSASLR